jgi:hypothetical protein
MQQITEHPSHGEDVDLDLLLEAHGIAAHQWPKGVMHLVNEVCPGGSAVVLLQVVAPISGLAFHAEGDEPHSPLIQHALDVEKLLCLVTPSHQISAACRSKESMWAACWRTSGLGGYGSGFYVSLPLWESLVTATERRLW